MTDSWVWSCHDFSLGLNKQAKVCVTSMSARRRAQKHKKKYCQTGQVRSIICNASWEKVDGGVIIFYQSAMEAYKLTLITHCRMEFLFATLMCMCKVCSSPVEPCHIHFIDLCDKDGIYTKNVATAISQYSQYNINCSAAAHDAVASHYLPHLFFNNEFILNVPHIVSEWMWLMVSEWTGL